MTSPFTLISLLGAVFSDDRQHRYWLWRIWDRRSHILVVCMFNPSTADERKDDRTIQELCQFAKLWGYGGILVVNLHSICSSDPGTVRVIGKAAWGDAQPAALGQALEIAAKQNSPVLVAWGQLANETDVTPFFEAGEHLDLICLGMTADGSPKHPMARGKHRIPRDQQPILWRAK